MKMTNLERCLDDCTAEQMKELRDLTGGWCKGGYNLFNAIATYQEKKTKKPNTAILKASCGQEMTLELEDIDESQDINEVTIRGVRYTPA